MDYYYQEINSDLVTSRLKYFTKLTFNLIFEGHFLQEEAPYLLAIYDHSVFWP